MLADSEEREDEEDMSQSVQEQSHNYSTTAKKESADDEASQQATTKSSTPRDLSEIKGKKRKRTRHERIESVLRTVVKEVVDAQQRSDQNVCRVGREADEV